MLTRSLSETLDGGGGEDAPLKTGQLQSVIAG